MQLRVSANEAISASSLLSRCIREPPDSIREREAGRERERELESQDAGAGIYPTIETTKISREPPNIQGHPRGRVNRERWPPSWILNAKFNRHCVSQVPWTNGSVILIIKFILITLSLVTPRGHVSLRTPWTKMRHTIKNTIESRTTANMVISSVFND